MPSDRYQGTTARFLVHQGSIFMPQVEQFEMEPVPIRFGFLARSGVPQANGWFWAAPLSGDAIVSVMRLAIVEDFPFFEQPDVEYSCISLLSTASAGFIDDVWATGESGSPVPSSSPVVGAEGERAMAFTVKPGRYDSPLAAGALHASVSVYLLPGCLERIGCDCPGDLDALSAALHGTIDVTGSLELRTVLRSITPRQASLPGALLHYRGKAQEAVCALAAFLEGSNGDRRASERDLVGHVKGLLAESLERPPTLDELAAACYTSRTTLCAAFKRECGMSVGAYLAELRIARAKELLATTDEPLAAVARSVGYRHASTFAAAFKRVCSITPMSWRASQGRQ